MKRLLTAAVALSLLGGTTASADPGHGHGNRHDDRFEHSDRGHHYGQRKHWARGERLPASYYQNRAYYVDYRVYHLRPPPRGYRWVRVDDDYMLIALTTGLIASIIANN